MKKAHLLCCSPRPLPAAYDFVRLSRVSVSALHLGLFDQPQQGGWDV